MHRVMYIYREKGTVVSASGHEECECAGFSGMDSVVDIVDLVDISALVSLQTRLPHLVSSGEAVGTLPHGPAW